MNLSSTIRRDGTKVFYLRVPEEVEAKEPVAISVMIKKIMRKFLSIHVEKSNKSNKRGNTWRRNRKH